MSKVYLEIYWGHDVHWRRWPWKGWDGWWFCLPFVAFHVNRKRYRDDSA